MEEGNIIKRFLEDGEENMKYYTTLDYNSLDSKQLSALKTLSFFSKHKESIIKYFGTNKSSVEGRIAFLEKNSMKLGAVIFNRVEQARLEVNHGYYILPYLAGSIAFVSLMVFARFTSMKSKLYRELGRVFFF